MGASEYINELIGILSQDPSFSGEISELRKKRERIDNDIIRVGVIGVTSSGKSTMLNSLLGEELLPAEAKPSSSQLVSCRRGTKRLAKIYFSDGRTILVEGSKLTSAIISKYGNENENKANKEKVSQIELISPNIPLPSNVELVDSPGLDAYGLDGHEQITMETLLPSVDFCIFVTTCKTNSDEKMRVVLNAIARFKKPVIVVQNMIDSLKGSPDGKKSKNEVAQEHVGRIVRIVDKSDIADKSSVYVVQISSMWALKCRMVLLRGGKLNEKGKIMWRESGFEFLEKILNKIPVQLKSKLESLNLAKLKADIDRIAGQINVIGTPKSLVLDTHDYKTDYYNLIDKVNSRIRCVMSSIDKEIESLEIYPIYSQRKIDDIKEKHTSWTDEVVGIMRFYNDGMKPIFKGLGISERDLRFTFIPSQAASIRIHTKTITKEVKQSGFGGWFKRVVSFGNWGYEKITETQNDWSETTKNVIQFLKRCKIDYKNQLNGWLQNILKCSSEIENAISTRNRLNEEAKSRHLDNEKKRTLLELLKKLSAKIPVERKDDFAKSGPTHAFHGNRDIVEWPLGYFYSYVQSKRLIKILHHKSFLRAFGDKKLVIYSWDDYSTKFFLSMSANLSESQISSIIGGADVQGIRVCKSSQTVSNSRASIDGRIRVILVNLTQPGAAKKQIMDLLTRASEMRYGKMIFVIQDLQEVINGGDLKSALFDMQDFLKRELSGCNFSWYALHSNPIYAVALMEMQTRSLRTQSDEMKLGNDLQRHMGRFYDAEVGNNIFSMMNAFLQK